MNESDSGIPVESVLPTGTSTTVQETTYCQIPVFRSYPSAKRMAAELADDIDTAIALGTGDPSPYTGAQLLQHVDDLLARFHIDDVLADLDLRWTLQTACARLTDLPPLVWPCDGVPWRTWSVARSSSIGQR